MRIGFASTRVCWLVIWALIPFGCTSPEGTQGSYSIQNVRYGSYGQAIRLSNGTAEAIVVPSISRIMHYSLVGDANLLWQNPQLVELLNAGEWVGLGGDRIWLWPESEWEQRTGRVWPPIPAYDDPSSVTIASDGRTIVLRSGVFADYGLRIVRHIRLADEGSELIATTYLVPEPGMKVQAAAAWEITKIPHPEWGLVRNRASAGMETPYAWLSREEDALSVEPLGPGFLRLRERRPDHVAKIGLDGDLLIAKLGNRILVQQNLSASKTGYKPNAMVQWYKSTHPVLTNPSEQGFVELEHTAPVTVPTAKSRPLVVVWSILALQNGSLRQEELTAYLNAFSASPLGN